MYGSSVRLYFSTHSPRSFSLQRSQEPAKTKCAFLRRCCTRCSLCALRFSSRSRTIGLGISSPGSNGSNSAFWVLTPFFLSMDFRRRCCCRFLFSSSARNLSSSISMCCTCLCRTLSGYDLLTASLKKLRWSIEVLLTPCSMQLSSSSSVESAMLISPVAKGFASDSDLSASFSVSFKRPSSSSTSFSSSFSVLVSSSLS